MAEKGPLHQKDNPLSRRGFLKIVALSSAAGAALKFGLTASRRPHHFTRSRILMGTVVNITIVGYDKKKAARAAERCLSVMKELESALSRYQPDSDLSRLNAQGRLDEAHPALLDIVQRSLAISRDSRGAFDITIKPLVDLYQKSQQRSGKLPSCRDMQRALSLVNHQDIIIEGAGILFAKPQMEITLDGIAKGYIVDQGMNALRENGFSRVMVEAGGDLYTGNLKYNNQPWRVGIQHPRPTGDQEYITSISAADQAVATSGDYQHTFSDDYRAHHILDPRTGFSPGEVASATVIAPETCLADTLSTTLLVMGIKKGLEWIEGREHCQAVIISKDLEIHTTSSLTTITTNDRTRKL